MDEADTVIRIRMEANTSGAEKAEKAHDRLESAAKRSAAETARSAQTAGQAIGKAASAVGKLRAVLAGLGVAGVFTALIGSIKTVADSFGKAQAEAEKFDRAQKEAARAREVAALAESYERLAKSIGDAAAANEHQLAMISKAAAAQRELEDAQARAAEQKELAAVDPDDPAAAERRDAVRAKYAGQAAARSAARGEQDIVFRTQELTVQAEQLDRGAAQTRAAAGADAGKIAELRALRKAALARSVSENGSDAGGFLGLFAKNVKDIATLNWGGVGDSRTEAGDAERAAAQAEAERLRGQIDALEKARDAKLQAASDAETQAARKREEAGIEMSRLDAVRLDREAAGTAAGMQNAAAQGALEAKQARIAADEALVAGAPGRLDELCARIAGAQGQIAAADENASAQAMEMALAQGQLDAFNASVGTRRTGVAKERAGLQANLDRETEEAREASGAAASLRSSLGELISQLTAEIKALEGEVKAAKSRINFNASEGGS